MLYSVKARYIESKLPEFFRKLHDGSISGQQPDGPNIMEAMQSARVTEPGVVQWVETCYCATPLAHERETVLDKFFTDMEILPVQSSPELDGEAFIAYLERRFS